MKFVGLSALAIGFIFSFSAHAESTVSKTQAFSQVSDPFEAGYPDRLVPGQLLLKLKGKDHSALGELMAKVQSQREFSALLDDVGRVGGVYLQYQRRLQFGWFLVELRTLDGKRPSEQMTEEVAALLTKHDALEYADTNLWHRPYRLPNDTFTQSMWPLARIGAQSAWDLSVGESTQRVGVIDSGTLRAHEDLSAKDVRGYDFISNSNQANDGNGRDADYDDSGNGANCGQGFQPDNFHGTHVAATILASTNNNQGVAGLNWNAQLVTARALGRCGGANGDILESMAWLAGFQVDGVPAIGADAVKVINMSLGSAGPCDNVSSDFVSTLVDNNVVIVAAAGNDGNNVPVGSPASCTGAIAVAAHGDGNNRPLAPYSNFSDRIDLVAPGGNLQQGQNGGVLSACGPASDCYVFYEGTSMAAPHVAGVVSLMQAVSPNATPAQLLNILQNTADNCGNCGTKGAIRMDLALAEAGGFEPPPPPAATFGESICGIGGNCEAGLQCLGTGDDTDPECFRACTTASECASGFQCVGTGDAALNVCAQTGEAGEGQNCTAFGDCGEGLFCVEGSCTERCDLGYSCSSADQTCVQGICQGGGAAPPPGEGEGEGEGESRGCDEARGHWDCESGNECREGECIRVITDAAFVGELCDEDNDCRAGLCDRGVCTKPCDYDCEDGYTCDEEAIPGGLCRAESCADSEGEICESDWWCTYSDAKRYVCAREGDDLYGSAFCAHSRVSSAAVPLAFGFLFVLAGVLGRRRVD